MHKANKTYFPLLIKVENNDIMLRMGNAKAGNIGNIRKSKYVSVLYWVLFYTYTFLIVTRWFIYEDPFVSDAFSHTMLYAHITLLGSIILGFLFLKKRNFAIPKRIMSGVVLAMILFGAIFEKMRTNIAYVLVLAAILGQLADCSLLTYIYEMNNAERLFGIVGCHLLTALVAATNCFFTRETATFHWIMFALAVGATVCSLFESKNEENVATVNEPFHKKLYVPLVLACFGAFFSVCSSMIVIGKVTTTLPYARLCYYGGAVFGAVYYYLLYRFAPKPVTLTLLSGFAASGVCIALFLTGKTNPFLLASSFFGGLTFNMCMMNLYYILCNIIRKYRNSNMLKVAPITSNFVGILIGFAFWGAVRYLPDDTLSVILLCCLVGNLLILSTVIFWERGLSVTAKQEEYVRLDTTVTKEQAYEIVGLTEKESEVANLLLEGLSLKEIAARLYVSENTAKTHRLNVYRKMEVSSREELIQKLGGNTGD